jgi:hypothetical protein
MCSAEADVRFGSKAESGGIYPIVFLTAMRARETSAGKTSAETPSITLAKDQCNKYSGAKFIRI